MTKFDIFGKTLIRTFLALLFVSCTSSAIAALADLQGATPKEASVTVLLNKPANAVNVLITLVAYDADFPDEGELIINGNAAIPLFGEAAVKANDQSSANITFSTPASYWKDGNNTLLFRHTSTQGYAIYDATVLFKAGLENGSETTTTSGGNNPDAGDSGTNTSQPETGSLNLSWVAPVTRADGAALALSEIAGYTLHYGTSKGNYPHSIAINDASATSVTVNNLSAGTYYMVMTTRDTNNQDISYSSMATKQTQ